MAIMQLTYIPLGTETASVGDYLVDVINEIKKRGFSYKINDMGTVIQGDGQDLLQLAAEIYQLPFKKGAKRVVTNIVIDDRRDKEISIGDKIKAIEDRMSD